MSAEHIAHLNRLVDVLFAERDRLKAANAELAAAIQAFMDYDADDDSLSSMYAYNTALDKCRAALAKHKGETQ